MHPERVDARRRHEHRRRAAGGSGRARARGASVVGVRDGHRSAWRSTIAAHRRRASAPCAASTSSTCAASRHDPARGRGAACRGRAGPGRSTGPASLAGTPSSVPVAEPRGQRCQVVERVGVSDRISGRRSRSAAGAPCVLGSRRRTRSRRSRARPRPAVARRVRVTTLDPLVEPRVQASSSLGEVDGTSCTSSCSARSAPRRAAATVADPRGVAQQREPRAAVGSSGSAPARRVAELERRAARGAPSASLERRGRPLPTRSHAERRRRRSRQPRSTRAPARSPNSCEVPRTRPGRRPRRSSGSRLARSTNAVGDAAGPSSTCASRACSDEPVRRPRSGRRRAVRAPLAACVLAREAAAAHVVGPPEHRRRDLRQRVVATSRTATATVVATAARDGHLAGTVDDPLAAPDSYTTGSPTYGVAACGSRSAPTTRATA